MGNRRPATEPAFANTRYPQRGCRAVCFICSVILAGGAFGGKGPSADATPLHAQETGCEQVPASRREQCLKVMSCLAVDDDDVRRACIEAAQRPPSQPVQPPPEAEPAEAVQPTQQPQETEPAQIVRPAQQREDPPPRAPEPPQVREEPVRQPAPVIQEQTIEPAKRESSRTPAKAEEAPKVSPEEPADQFEGTISRIYQSILDRQLIAVDSKYLFESDRASHARLKEGERVTVAKVSSRFWTGRKWRVTGSSRTPVVGYRVRCEKQDIRSEDRRKCRQMLDR